MLGKLSNPSTCLFIQAAQPVCRYVVVRETEDQPALVAAGSFELNELDAIAQHARQELENQGISVSRAVLLLPRGDVEVNSLQLPPASDDELPDMVAHLLAQQMDDSDPVVHDFLVATDRSKMESDETAPAGEADELLSFTVSAKKLDAWTERFKSQKLKLEAVTFGGIGAVQLLGRVSTKPARTSIVVTTTDQDTDLAVVEGGRPVLFRTIPRATGGEQFVIDQLSSDIQRTLTLVGHPDDEETRVYLIGTLAEQADAATRLSEKLSLSVSLVNPFDQLDGEAVVDKPSRFANLIGTACAWNRKAMSIDLLHPRRPTPKPSLWKRFGFWGIVAASLLALGAFLLSEKLADQRTELADRQLQFERLVKQAKKAQTKMKVVGAIDTWRQNEISWLDELDSFSKRIPPASDATISSLSMYSGGTRGRMDMSVEVSDPSVRLALEEAIGDRRHSIRSKRVTDASNRSNSVWRFQTMVTIVPKPVPLPELPSDAKVGAKVVSDGAELTAEPAAELDRKLEAELAPDLEPRLNPQGNQVTEANDE